MIPTDLLVAVLPQSSAAGAKIIQGQINSANTYKKHTDHPKTLPTTPSTPRNPRSRAELDRTLPRRPRALEAGRRGAGRSARPIPPAERARERIVLERAAKASRAPAVRTPGRPCAVSSLVPA